eukprot:350758-Chlamydomonas_euryale.AAC.10
MCAVSGMLSAAAASDRAQINGEVELIWAFDPWRSSNAQHSGFERPELAPFNCRGVAGANCFHCWQRRPPSGNPIGRSAPATVFETRFSRAPRVM